VTSEPRRHSSGPGEDHSPVVRHRRQHWDRGNLLLAKIRPHDAPWPVGGTAEDDLVGRDDVVHREVVLVVGQRLVDDLELVHRRGDDRRGPDEPGLGQQPDLDVGVAGALADAHPLAIDRHRAADDQINGVHVRHGRLRCTQGGYATGGERLGLVTHLAGIEPEERQRVGQLRLFALGRIVSPCDHFE